MLVFVKGKISRAVGYDLGHVRVQRVEGVTADSTAWTADTICVTADGRIVCIAAGVLEQANALDQSNAVSIVSAAAIEAANALDVLDAANVVSATVLEVANALDELDAASITSASVVETANASDETDAAIGAQVHFGTVDEPAAAIDALDAVVVPLVAAVGGGGGIIRPPRPFPVEGYGYGVLPELEGEAHGVVLAVGLGAGTLPAPDAELVGAIGAAGRSLALLDVRGTASGVRGQAGAAMAELKGLDVTGAGAAVVRGKGLGMIIELAGAAKGRHDDDEAAAVVAWLLAA
jgi:hypothetical protein